MDPSRLEMVTRGIAAHLAEWEIAHVERAVYGLAEPEFIAAELDRFCRTQLQSGIADILFYQSSIGAVAGLILEDSRRVVIKAHPPSVPSQRLAEIVALREKLESATGLAPRVLAGPAPLGQGLGTAEVCVERGEWRDPHLPPVCRALGRSFHRVVQCLDPWSEASLLPGHPVASLPRDELWPVPHSRLFDFDSTTAGAEYIDALAAKARALMVPAGRVVLGHGDWRAEHVRFEGDEPVVAFDWDSLCRDREPALVGAAAHAFCADWSRTGHVQAPTMEEAREFVAAYETARGRRFTVEERQLCSGAFAYGVGYTARCGHAAGIDDRGQPGSFQYLIAVEGDRLLRL